MRMRLSLSLVNQKTKQAIEAGNFFSETERGDRYLS